MKKMAAKILFFALLLGVILTLLLFCPWPAQEPFRNLPRKHQIIKQIAGKKIILVGGSGVGYGLSARTIQAEIPGYRAVNMGLNGGLGLQFNLNEIKQYLNPGDLVLLSPEYGNFGGGHRGGIQILKAISIAPEVIRYVPRDRLLELMRDHAIDFFQLKAQTYFDGWANIFTKSSAQIDSFGDNVTKSISRDVSKMPFSLRVDEKSYQECIQLLNEFDAYCRERQAKALLSFPSLPVPQYTTCRRDIESLSERIRKDCTMQVLNSPEEAMFEPSFFDDTVYHLNHRGKELRSLMVAGWIKTLLAASIGAPSGPN